MPCEFGPDTDLLFRPYPYGREPFQLASGELVAYEGRFFSLPAFALINDIRLFTPAASHPVASPFRLYINKDAGLSIAIEPQLTASGYTEATPHYAEIITDMRNALDDVFDRHASDSSHVANSFRIAHFERNRAPYSDTSAADVLNDKFVHPDPKAVVPSGSTPAGSSGSLPPPGDGYELGARQFQDIDIDEIMWQPFIRPKSVATLSNGVPFEPIFPAVLTTVGDLPIFSDLDNEKYGQLALGASVSGGVIITGDALLEGSSVKLMRNSGHTFIGSAGNFQEVVPWAEFPAGKELCRYGGNQYDATKPTISASGRQAIYAPPKPGSDRGVYLLAVSASTDISGLPIQHSPAQHRNLEGITVSSGTFAGVHVTDQLIFSLTEMAPGQPTKGRSPINGKIVFAHFAGEEVSSKGHSVLGRITYAKNNSIFGFDSVTNPAVSFVNGISTVEWYSTNETLSPINWTTFNVTSLRPSRGLFGNRDSTVYTYADIINSFQDGTVIRLAYAQWGFIDRIICPAGADQGRGGDRRQEIIEYKTRVYESSTGSAAGWVELDPPESPLTTTQTVTFYEDTYGVNNIFSFFFLRKPNNGFVVANGEIFVQWSDTVGFASTFPQTNKFAPLGARATRLEPRTNRTDVVVAVGFFPNWALKRYVTTNNQVRIPTDMILSPALSSVISIDPSVGILVDDVNTFGPPIWDANVGVNYIYFSTLLDAPAPIAGKIFFAKMDTDFVITEVNEVAQSDAILSGRAALLDI